MNGNVVIVDSTMKIVTRYVRRVRHLNQCVQLVKYFQVTQKDARHRLEQLKPRTIEDLRRVINWIQVLKNHHMKWIYLMMKNLRIRHQFDREIVKKQPLLRYQTIIIEQVSIVHFFSSFSSSGLISDSFKEQSPSPRRSTSPSSKPDVKHPQDDYMFDSTKKTTDSSSMAYLPDTYGPSGRKHFSESPSFSPPPPPDYVSSVRAQKETGMDHRTSINDNT
jgi:hypothetical protein